MNNDLTIERLLAHRRLSLDHKAWLKEMRYARFDSSPMARNYLGGKKLYQIVTTKGLYYVQFPCAIDEQRRHARFTSLIEAFYFLDHMRPNPELTAVGCDSGLTYRGHAKLVYKMDGVKWGKGIREDVMFSGRILQKKDIGKC